MTLPNDMTRGIFSTVGEVSRPHVYVVYDWQVSVTADPFN